MHFHAAILLLCAGLAGPVQSDDLGATSGVEVTQGTQGHQLTYAAPGAPSSVLRFSPNAIHGARAVNTGEIVVVAWSERLGSGESESWYRISLDGGATFSRERRTSYELMLNYAAFDPLADGEPAVPADLQARAGHDLYIVQYVTQGLEVWRDEIRAMGGVDQRFLAWHANIWEMNAQAAAEVSRLPFVRWVGPFHPAYKLEPRLMEDYRANDLRAQRFRIVVGDWGPAQKAVLTDHILALGGTIDRTIDEGWVVEATLDGRQLIEVIHDTEVFGVDRWSVPETDMNNVRNLMGADYVEGLTGYDGTGVRAEVMDDGLDTGRPEWRHAPILHGSVTSGSHGTSTYSINFADTGGTARGMAPDAQGIIADYGSYGGNRYTHTAQLNGLPYEAVYQSNSWGNARTRSYTSISQEMDDIIFINDVVITQSQSNAGNQDSRPQAWAKNIVAVGGIRHYNNTNNSDDDWSFGASTGPAADGRVKPDLSAFYDSISTVNNSSFGGTSAASPTVAGHFAVLFEMWHNGDFNNPTGVSVFDSRPHSTTSRAIMINSAWQWPDNQADITRFRQGWGRPDVRYMYDNAGDVFWVDETDVIANLQTRSYTVDVQSGSPELRATLVYLDPAGTTSSSLHRINDLSLKVTSPGGTIYWGNNGLTSGSYNTSTSGGSSNTIDCVEQVIVPNPQVGTWDIDVIADEINQDSHVETGALDADYALVVSGGVGGGGGPGPLDLTISPFVGGQPATATTTGALPGAEVFVYFTFKGFGSTFIPGLNVTLGLKSAKLAGSSFADPGGTATFSGNVPASVSGRLIYVQSAAQDTISQIRVALIG